MSGRFEDSNFIWLTLSLVGLMVTAIVSRDFPANLTLQILEISSIVLLFLSLLSLRGNQTWGRRFIALAVLIFGVIVLREITLLWYFEYFYLALVLLFMLMAAWLVGKHVLLTGTVNLNILTGSVALYLLLGLIWALTYTIVLEVSPEALSGFEVADWYENLPSTIYFSFVTLTTLGYGDITPATPVAQVLVILEAICGMFYLAVIVASLVGAMRSRESS